MRLGFMEIVRQYTVFWWKIWRRDALLKWPKEKFNSSHSTTTIQLDLNADSKITTNIFLDLTFMSYKYLEGSNKI